MMEKGLSKRTSIQKVEDLRKQLLDLELENSTLLKIAQESFIMGSNSHLNSLTPELREELGFELNFMTQQDPKLSSSYKEKKNKYLGLGKSYASVSFLFDLIDEDLSILDILLLQEILMDDGEFRKEKVIIKHPDESVLEFPPEGISELINDVFSWYYGIKDNPEISPVVIAILFHFKLVSIHPFTDGNGRLSRLFLNLILLKNNLFPIAIPNSKRKEYYDSLMSADAGDFESLIDYFADLVSEKIEQYLSIAEELKDIDEQKEFLILTEDGNTGMIEKLLEIHGIDLDKTQVESYDGKDNLAAATFFAKKLIAKSPNLKRILIHRDRDNDNPEQLKQKIQKHLRSFELESITTILITKFYDMESYFLNPNHIKELYNDISIEKAKELIDQATLDTSETSKSKLRIAYADYGKFGKMIDPQEKAIEINEMYDADPEKYRYGKDVLFRLEELIAHELGLLEKVDLAQFSSNLKITEIESFRNL